MAESALVKLERPGLLRDFVAPLVLGEPVHVGGPLTREDLEGLVAQAQGPGELDGLLLQMQRQARELTPEPVLVELGPQEMVLAAVAYQVAWYFHDSVERRKVWQRRLTYQAEQGERLLSRVGLPQTQGRLLGRHLLLRHVARLFRTDTRLEFGAVWGPVSFFGQEPRWRKLPLRGDPLVEKRRVWVSREVFGRPAAPLYYGLMARSPLTSLLDCERLHPHFTFWGSAWALGLPWMCRLVTSAYVGKGLEAVMPALWQAFWRYAEDRGEPLGQRRYLARFLLNLGLTHCMFTPPERLEVFEGNPKAHPYVPKAEGGEAALREQARGFHDLFWALYEFRGFLGGAHLVSAGQLEARVAAFSSALVGRDEQRRVARERLRVALELAGP